jgi:hypothetical protein
MADVTELACRVSCVIVSGKRVLAMVIRVTRRAREARSIGSDAPQLIESEPDDPSVAPNSDPVLSRSTTTQGMCALQRVDVDVAGGPIPVNPGTPRWRPLAPLVKYLLLGALLAISCGKPDSPQPTGIPGTASVPRLSADGEHGEAQTPARTHVNSPVKEAATAPGATPTPSDAREKSEPFEIFWSAFRRAMLDEDLETLAQLTRFPISARGTLDDDAIRPVSRRKLGTLVRTLMKQPVAAPGKPQTHKQYLQAQELPPSDALESSGDHARVGDLVFDLEGNGWRWTEAYSE